MEVFTFTYQGREWHYDPAAVTVDEWRELKRKYKMTPAGYETGLDDADPDALTFLYWIMLRQNGQAGQPLGDHLKPDILQLNHAVGTAAMDIIKGRLQAAAETGAEAEPDPTSGQSPASPASPAPSPPFPATPATAAAPPAAQTAPTGS